MKSKVKQTGILTITAMCLSILIQAQPASAFLPTNIVITPNPVNIPCGGAGIVTVVITGTIDNFDGQSQWFEVTLVDGDTFSDDDLGIIRVTPATDGGGEFVPFQGPPRTFTLVFDIWCDPCSIRGPIESSGEAEAELAIEVSAGRFDDSTNLYHTATGDYVLVRCVPPGQATPTGYEHSVSYDLTTVTFADVTTGGVTTITPQSENPGIKPPYGYQFAGYFVDVKTTADYVGPVTVCINYAGLPLAILDRQDCTLFHWTGAHWVNITSSINPETHTVCGEVYSLSWFGLAIQPSVGGVALPVDKVDLILDILWPR